MGQWDGKAQGQKCIMNIIQNVLAVLTRPFHPIERNLVSKCMKPGGAEEARCPMQQALTNRTHMVPAPPVPLTLANLPAPDTSRWVARRKAQVVGAVQIGLLTLDEALARYKLSIEEFTSWQRALYRHGLRGL